jgi:cation/acetate symporter
LRSRSFSTNTWIVIYITGLLVLLSVLAMAEHFGMRRDTIGWILMGATILMYSTVGFVCRTSEPLNYYVAGRSVSALHNGMASAADWISAASFVSLMGTMYATGYSSHVFVMGWTGGFCLLALLVAPYMRRLGEFTLPDFFVRCYGGQSVRILSALAVVVCCFIYVIAQIYAVGLITSRMVGVDFVIGIYLGLSSVLLCSFLGGMRAITWTQVAQYIVMFLAIVLPLSWLSWKQPEAPWKVFDYKQKIEQIEQLEKRFALNPAEIQVQEIYRIKIAEIQEKIAQPQKTIWAESQALRSRLAQLRAQNTSSEEIFMTEQQLQFLSADQARLVQRWRNQLDTYQNLLSASQTRAFSNQAESGSTQRAEDKNSNTDAINFLALVLMLCLGTACMPHLLMRYQTTPNVAQTRTAVSWTLFFILAIYFCLPALALLVKLEVLTQVVGLPMDQLPSWLRQWSRLAPNLVTFTDINLDGIVQANEFLLGNDVVMLAMPEIAGMPYFISAIVAAGALAAALSTADGLLLAITAAFSRDLMALLPSLRAMAWPVHKAQDEQNNRERGLIGSKVILLSVATAASYVAAQRPAGIVAMVTLAFSLAAATFFVPLVAAIFWRKANRYGAIAAMVCGAGVTLYYWLSSFGGDSAVAAAPSGLWMGIRPVASGLLGVVAAAIAMLLVSWLTSGYSGAPSDAIDQMHDAKNSSDLG